MGLTFQQSFNRVPEKVLLVTTAQGHPVAIIEMPQDEHKRAALQAIIGLMPSKILMTRVIDFDKLIRQGYDLLKELGIEKDERNNEYGIY